jgi:hypothetical protein
VSDFSLLELMVIHQNADALSDMPMGPNRLSRLLPLTSRSFFARALGALHLNLMGVDDGGDESREPAFDFWASRSVVHFHAASFGANQTGFAQGLKMMRQGRLGDFLFRDVQESRTIVSAVRGGQIGKDGDTYRIGQGMEDSFDGHVFDGGMKQGSHTSGR